MSKSEGLIVWHREGDLFRVGARCAECGGMGRFFGTTDIEVDCEHCGGLGWFGIDPELPVMASPGTEAKVAMLTVRYVSGSPLFHPDDGYDPNGAPPQRTASFTLTPAELQSIAQSLAS